MSATLGSRERFCGAVGSAAMATIKSPVTKFTWNKPCDRGDVERWLAIRRELLLHAMNA
jgi:hypothetical protein